MQLALEKMTTTEKLRLIEDVWDDLCHSGEEVPVPSWHRDELQKREEMIQSGSATFLDLDDAKQQLRRRVS